MFAIAYVISSFFAPNNGAEATIAVAPQILVPMAVKIAKLRGILNFLLIKITKVMDEIIQIIITGKLIIPNCINSYKPNLIPSNTIPIFNRYFKLKSNPLKLDSGREKELLNSIPTMIAIIIGEMGLFVKPKIWVPMISLK